MRILINQMSLITVTFEDVFLMELSNSARLSMQLHYSLHQYSLRYTNFLLHLTQSRPLFIRTPSGPRLKSKIAKSLLNPWSIVNSNFQSQVIYVVSKLLKGVINEVGNPDLQIELLLNLTHQNRHWLHLCKILKTISFFWFFCLLGFIFGGGGGGDGGPVLLNIHTPIKNPNKNLITYQKMSAPHIYMYVII